MKLLTFERNGSASYGVVVDGGVVDLGARLSDLPTLKSVLEAGALDRLRETAARASADFGTAEITFLQTIPDAGRILCVGQNYRKHIEEMGRPAPAYPNVFVRHPDGQVGHGGEMVAPKASDHFDFEGELAVIIGRTGRHISSEDALSHVAGYSCFNDGSIRDFQRHASQFTPGKNFFHSGSFGPWMVTTDELPDPSVLTLETRLNGQVMQHAETDDLVFDVPTIISYLSQCFPFRPGDVIATGTPGGVGTARKPPVYMKAGDRIEVELSGIGVLANTIVDE